MPEYLRAFVVIIFFMVISWIISRKIFSRWVSVTFVNQLFQCGFAATALLFLSRDVWLFLGGFVLLLLTLGRRVSSPLALYFFLLLTIPVVDQNVPGFGLINYLITLNHVRLMAVLLLLPAAFALVRMPGTLKPGALLADKVILLYILYSTALAFYQYQTLTGALRHFVTMMLDMGLVYFVVSRSFATPGNTRAILVSFATASIFLSLVAGFEFMKGWLLYSGVTNLLSQGVASLIYLERGNVLRALATTTQPIALGYVMMVSLLLLYYTRRLADGAKASYLLISILSIGLLAAMSRGPWVGFAVGIFVCAIYSGRPGFNMTKIVLLAFLGGGLLWALPGGERVIDYLPWVGTIDAGNITFRETLWQQSWKVVERSPWIGSLDYTDSREFDVIRLGTGFVDIVNTYLGLLLGTGFIGLAFYLAWIGLALQGAVSLARKAPEGTEAAVLGAALVAALVASVVTLWTVSSVSTIAPVATFLMSAGVGCGALSKLFCQPSTMRLIVSSNRAS